MPILVKKSTTPRQNLGVELQYRSYLFKKSANFGQKIDHYQAKFGF